MFIERCNVEKNGKALDVVVDPSRSLVLGIVKNKCTVL